MLSNLGHLLCCFIFIMGLQVGCLLEEKKIKRNETKLPSTRNNSNNQPKHVYLRTHEITQENYNFPIHIHQSITRNNTKRRKKNSKKIVVTAYSILKNTTTTTNSPLTEQRKRKRKRRRRKKKLQNTNNILEVTTAKNIRTNKSILNNATLLSVIDTLNRNMGNLRNKNDDQIAATFIQKLTDSKRSKKRNRCSKNNGGCSQICHEKGKNKCSCLLGYKLAKNRKKCLDINECQLRNGGCKQICLNTLGAFYCDCVPGLRLSDDSRTCQDVNECHLRNGHGPCQDTCTNSHGSYICDCSRLNGTRLSSDKHTCQDINECEGRNHGCSHICINTKVGAFCSCPAGWELMSDYKTCQDTDECEDTPLCQNGCVNTIGSYYCEDNIQNDEALNRTRIPVCPPLEPPEQGFITCFRNNPTPYDTYANDGRKIIRNTPGTKCQLRCPIGFKLVGENRFVCGISGKWKIRRKGFCAKSEAPRIECPLNQVFYLKESNKTLVKFSRPRTNVKWKIVKSYPAWARDLYGVLGLGQHFIQFSVTDPMTELSAKCSFSITVKQ